MEMQLLKERDVVPSDEVLAQALGDVWPVFETFRAMAAELGVEIEWRYYNDGKAWLGKAAARGRTVLWLSVWEGWFQASFYFLERHMEGLAALGLDEGGYELASEWGRMIPLIFRVSRPEQLTDVMKMVEFKKTTR
ncbi:MAG: DUF3788 domain-containing protein [Alistipes sp.]|nr:DUF3788 domain-containing protein [Alistipes sp.]